MKNKRNNQFSVRITSEQIEKIESVCRQQGFKRHPDAIRKIVDLFKPKCERCKCDNAKRVIIDEKVKFLCAACIEK